MEEEEEEEEEKEEEELLNGACCPRILVVDDDEFNIQALCKLIEICGYDSHSALNGDMALTLVEEKENSPCNHNYSLIFLDCNMPIKNGYDTCKELYELQ